MVRPRRARSTMRRQLLATVCSVGTVASLGAQIVEPVRLTFYDSGVALVQTAGDRPSLVQSSAEIIAHIE
jgi:hypothetical protein